MTFVSGIYGGFNLPQNCLKKPKTIHRDRPDLWLF